MFYDINVSLFTAVQEQQIGNNKEKDKLDNLLRHNLFLENKRQIMIKNF